MAAGMLAGAGVALAALVVAVVFAALRAHGWRLVLVAQGKPITAATQGGDEMVMLALVICALAGGAYLLATWVASDRFEEGAALHPAGFMVALVATATFAPRQIVEAHLAMELQDEAVAAAALWGGPFAGYVEWLTLAELGEAVLALVGPLGVWFVVARLALRHGKSA